jgi:16S rRNA (uracil1498-N3)-methyltransferase
VISLLIEPEELAAGRARVAGDAYRHLFRARRVEAGARLRVTDGRGGARWGVVERVESAAAWLALGDEAPANEAALRLELFVPLPKPERAAWLVEKATEVGVAAVRFVSAERAPRGVGEGRLGRLRRIAAQAVEQSQRAVVPAVSGAHDWSEVAALVAGLPQRYLLDAAAPDASAALARRPAAGPAALFVGPEGGFTEGERQDLQRLGCAPLGLGPRVLRLETAAVVGAGLLIANTAT